MELGEVNDSRPYEIDLETLQGAVDIANRTKKGLRGRFNHDGAELASHLGRWSALRIEDGAIRADLTLARSAKISPKGDLYEYTLSLAEEDPEAFGASLAGKLTDECYMAIWEARRGDKIPLRWERLWAADVVGEPAATRGGLFSQQENDMADETRLEAPPEPEAEVVLEETPDTEPAPQVPEVTLESLREDAKPFVEAFGDQGASWFLSGRTLLECFQETTTTLRKSLDEAKAELAQAYEQLEAAILASGEEDALSQEPREELSPSKADAKARATELEEKGAEPTVAKWGAGLKGQ